MYVEECVWVDLCVTRLSRGTSSCVKVKGLDETRRMIYAIMVGMSTSWNKF